jgi:quinol monooxygenase YgiN
MAEWWSIEVFHGELSADRWRDAYGSALIEPAITSGALDWEWHRNQWGVVFEVSFADEAAWESFRELPQVRAALDAVPDRVNGLLIYRGRGGAAGTPSRRPPRPSAGAGALELPEPEAERVVDLTRIGEAGQGDDLTAVPA